MKIKHNNALHPVRSSVNELINFIIIIYTLLLLNELSLTKAVMKSQVKIRNYLKPKHASHIAHEYGAKFLVHHSPKHIHYCI